MRNCEAIRRWPPLRRALRLGTPESAPWRGPLEEARWTGTSALTPDPSPIGWARGAPRRGRKLRHDEASSDLRFSTSSGSRRLTAVALLAANRSDGERWTVVPGPAL